MTTLTYLHYGYSSQLEVVEEQPHPATGAGVTLAGDDVFCTQIPRVLIGEERGGDDSTHAEVASLHCPGTGLPHDHLPVSWKRQRSSK